MIDIIGDYAAFFRGVARQLAEAGIDIAGREISHLAYRTATFDDYLQTREAIERRCIANVENQWNGRPISKLLLRDSLLLGDGYEVRLVELIPPPHRQAYPTGLEHVGIVLGEDFEAFCETYADVFSGYQDQGPHCQPRYVTFADNRTVKFYRDSLKAVVEKEGRAFDGLQHAAAIRRPSD